MKLKILVSLLAILIITLLSLILLDKVHATMTTRSLRTIVSDFHHMVFGAEEELEEVMIYGNLVLGTIRIDRLEIEYPIIQFVDESSLDIAICKYSGAGINQVGNVSLLGHNMRNGIFFSNLYQLDIGDTMRLMDRRRKHSNLFSIRHVYCKT